MYVCFIKNKKQLNEVKTDVASRKARDTPSAGLDKFDCRALACRYM